MTHVCYLDVTPLKDDAVFSHCLTLLSDARRKKVLALRSPDARWLSLGAGLLIDDGLRTVGLREKEMRYRTGENGKPFFADVPSLRFSISHTGSTVLVVLTDEGEVGCDVEKIGTADLRIARRFFCPEETEYVFGFDTQEERNAAFYRLWTLKESYIKLTGEGMALPMNGFLVDETPDGWCVRRGDVREDCSVQSCTCISGCAAAFAAYGKMLLPAPERCELLSLI